MLVEVVNVRQHRAGRQGFDTGFVNVTTVEDDLMSMVCYVSGIYIANTSAVAVTVTLKEKTTTKTFFSKSLVAGEAVNLFFSEPMKVEGIRMVASAAGAVIKAFGYL